MVHAPVSRWNGKGALLMRFAVPAIGSHALPAATGCPLRPSPTGGGRTNLMRCAGVAPARAPYPFVLRRGGIRGGPCGRCARFQLQTGCSSVVVSGWRCMMSSFRGRLVRRVSELAFWESISALGGYGPMRRPLQLTAWHAMSSWVCLLHCACLRGSGNVRSSSRFSRFIIRSKWVDQCRRAIARTYLQKYNVETFACGKQSALPGSLSH